MRVVNPLENYRSRKKLFSTADRYEFVKRRFTQGFFTDDQVESLVPGNKMEEKLTSLDRLSDLRKTTYLSTILAGDYTSYMESDILHKVDRATMSTSLEGRDPLLDHRIVEYAALLPDKMKIDGGISKKILRSVVHKHIPREMMERPKKGFSIPVGKWLRNELRKDIDRAFSVVASNQYGLDGSATEMIKSRWLRKGDSKDDVKMWLIFSYLKWFERWM